MEHLKNKKDLIEMIKNVLAIEKVARSDYESDINTFKNFQIVNIIKAIKSDEDKHIMLLEGCLKLLLESPANE